MLTNRALLFLAVFLAAVPAIPEALSQQPPARESQQNTAQEQRGTESAPVVVKVITPEKSDADLAKEEAKEKESLAVEERLADLTGDLAGYTKGLFIATLVLAGLTAGLLGLGVFQVRDAKRSIAAAETAANAARDQVKLSADEFRIVHRPRMRLRYVNGPEATDDGKWEFQAYLANVGDSVATIKSFTFSAWVPDSRGDEAHIELIPVTVGILPIEVGAGALMRGTAKDWTAFDNVFSQFLTVTGRIVYEDSAGTSRITAFARQKTGLDGRFRVSDKYAADEYED